MVTPESFANGIHGVIVVRYNAELYGCCFLPLLSRHFILCTKLCVPGSTRRGSKKPHVSIPSRTFGQFSQFAFYFSPILVTTLMEVKFAAPAPKKYSRTPNPCAPTETTTHQTALPLDFQLDRADKYWPRRELGKRRINQERNWLRDELGKRKEHFRTKTESCTVGHRRTVPVSQEFMVGFFSKKSFRSGARNCECVLAF